MFRFIVYPRTTAETASLNQPEKFLHLQMLALLRLHTVSKSSIISFAFSNQCLLRQQNVHQTDQGIQCTQTLTLTLFCIAVANFNLAWAMAQALIDLKHLFIIHILIRMIFKPWPGQVSNFNTSYVCMPI
jgi:hypothetical protein